MPSRPFMSARFASFGEMIDCVTMSCADCGCVVRRGLVVHPCGRDECCCTHLPVQTMEVLAAEIRRAMESADLRAIGELLASDARWGAPEQEVPTCRNAQQILSWYELARDSGVRADVSETVVIGENIVLLSRPHHGALDAERRTVMLGKLLVVPPPMNTSCVQYGK